MKSHFFEFKELSARMLRRGDTFAFGNSTYGLFLLLALALVGCAAAPQRSLNDWLAGQGVDAWQESPRLRTVWLRQGVGPLHLYIEGDGRAYIDQATPSRDPTPGNPVALQLALSDQGGGPVAYVGRPCQWQEGGTELRDYGTAELRIEVNLEGRGNKAAKSCGDNRDWTVRRFSPDMVAAQVRAIEQVVSCEVFVGSGCVAADDVVLIGFSGGAFIAQMAAVRLAELGKNVRLVTVAGNLDPWAVNAHHRVPTPDDWVRWQDFAAELQAIPQVHYVGSRDRIVPPEIAQSYVRRLGAGSVRVVERAGHSGDWVTGVQVTK